MTIFHKITLQALKKNRTRTTVTIIGIILSTAMITAVACFALSLQSYMVNGAIQKYGSWHAEFIDVPAAFIQERAQDDGVSSTTAYENIGYAWLDGGHNPNKPYLFLAGFDEDSFKNLPLTLLSGRLPQNDAEILVPAHVAANGGVQISVGDSLSLAVGNRQDESGTLWQHDPYRSEEESGTAPETLTVTAEKTYTVVGICQRPAFEEYSAPGYTLITTASALPTERYSLFVTLNNPRQVHSYVNSAAGDYAYVLNEDVLRFLGLASDKTFNTLLYAIGGILIALIMLGSIFLIYNSFNISLNDRMRQLGILMSVGATEKQLRHAVLFEGLCLGAIGIPLGILTGIPSIQLVLSLVAKNFANVLYDNAALTLVISAPALIAAAAVSMVTILISAYIPAKKVLATPVIECIRQNSAIKTDANAVKISAFARRFYGLEETLALKNFKRNKRRYKSIILSLSLSVLLFVSADAFVTYLNQVSENSTVVVEDYDICFYTRDIAENELFQLYDALKTTAGVTSSSYQALSTYACTLRAKDLPEHFLAEFREPLGYDGTSDTLEILLDVQFLPEPVYKSLLESLGLSAAEYSGLEQKMMITGLLPGHWYTQEQPFELTLRSKDGEQTKTIQATFVQDYPDLLPADPGQWPGYTLMVMAPYAAKPQFDALEATVKPTKLGLTFQSDTPGQSAAQMQAIIDSTGLTSGYSFYNVYGLLEQSRNVTFIIQLFSAVFILMISLIAVANVFNTISTNILLRRRELAMLRSVGMSDRNFKKMMRFECVLYGARTMFWSLPLSLGLVYLIYLGMLRGGAAVKFVFPWASIAVSIAGVFLIVFVTMLYTTNKIRKENIIDALRDELT